MSDLWPEDLQVEAVKVPAAILKEQAAALSERTKNLLQGRVVAEPGTDPTDATADQFTWHFQLFAPALNYTYDLFSINHDIELYPLIIETEDEELAEEYDDDISISDEEELLKLLRRIFSSVRTRRIVRALVAQAAEAAARAAEEAARAAEAAARAAEAAAAAPSASSVSSPSSASAASPVPSSWALSSAPSAASPPAASSASAASSSAASSASAASSPAASSASASSTPAPSAASAKSSPPESVASAASAASSPPASASAAAWPVPSASSPVPASSQALVLPGSDEEDAASEEPREPAAEAE